MTSLPTAYNREALVFLATWYEAFSGAVNRSILPGLQVKEKGMLSFKIHPLFSCPILVDFFSALVLSSRLFARLR